MRTRINLIIMFAALGLVACGPGIDDKKKSTFNSSQNNSTMNNNTGTNSQNSGTNNVVANNVSPNNVANNTSTNNVSTNNVANNTSTNNANNVSTNNGNNTATNNGNNTNDGVEQKCNDFCELLTGNCVTSRCSLDTSTEQARQEWFDECTGVGTESCQFRYRNESAYAADVDDLLTLGCSSRDWNQIRCRNFGTDQCDCEAPTYGTTCTQDADCDGGILNGYCNEESGDSYPGGQCLAGGCWIPNDAQDGDAFGGPTTGCGEEGICFVLDANNRSAICLNLCTRNSDCDRYVTGPNQSGYSCAEVGEFNDGTFFGICQTACSTDADCDTGQLCSQTWACQSECTTDSDCEDPFVCTGTSQGGQSHCEYPG